MPYLFAEHTLDPDRRELRRGSDLIAVEPQVFDLLLYLVQSRDRVVSRDDLMAAVWSGRIVSDSTLDSRINAVRKAVGDNGHEQRLIRTIPRKGIRFVGEVHEQVCRQGPTAKADRRPHAEPLPPLVADRPSIAVLPFENLSEDRALELIVNGLAEDVIALLARVPGFFVIARASSFMYRLGSTEIRRVGAELGVRYVVTGSARSTAELVRITVQLVEAESGNQLWAGRYDVERGDTLQLQDEIARRLMGELEPALTKADLQIIRRRRTESVDAWSHFRQAAGIIAVQGWNEELIDEALRQLRQAVAVDAGFALARALLALLSAFGANLSLVKDRAGAERDAKTEAEKPLLYGVVEIIPEPSSGWLLASGGLAGLAWAIRSRRLLSRRSKSSF